MIAVTVDANCVRAFVVALDALEHETRATVTATQDGAPWAVVSVAPLTDSKRAVMPLDASGVTGDSRKRGQCGVMVARGDVNALQVVINRAVRMHGVNA